MSRPSKIEPASTWIMRRIQLIKVVFPAPLFPNKQTICPSFMERFRFFKTSFALKLFFKPLISSIYHLLDQGNIIGIKLSLFTMKSRYLIPIFTSTVTDSYAFYIIYILHLTHRFSFLLHKYISLHICSPPFRSNFSNSFLNKKRRTSAF